MMDMWSKISLFAANETGVSINTKDSSVSLLKRGDGGAPEGLHVRAGCTVAVQRLVNRLLK